MDVDDLRDELDETSDTPPRESIDGSFFAAHMRCCRDDSRDAKRELRESACRLGRLTSSLRVSTRAPSTLTRMFRERGEHDGGMALFSAVAPVGDCAGSAPAVVCEALAAAGGDERGDWGENTDEDDDVAVVVAVVAEEVLPW